MSYFSLEYFLQISMTLWFQLLFIFLLTLIIKYYYVPLHKIDFLIAWFFTGIYSNWFERRLTAPLKNVKQEFIKPDKNIYINREKIGYRTPVTAMEAWLCHIPVDYSIFWDYEIDCEEAKQALSRLLAKVPIIGGVLCKIDETTMGIDHSNPQIDFLYGESDLIPSIDPNDQKKPNWYMKYTRGGNFGFPYPKGKPVFKATLIHYPNLKKNGEKATLIAIGSSHSLHDGEAFFMIMRCWGNEIRGISDYEIPNFDRSKLIIKPNEIKDFKPNTVILGQNFELSTAPYFWNKSAIPPSRYWVPYVWNFTIDDINALKQTALQGSKGEQLKKMVVSTNDIITALFWKLRGLLNRNYEFRHPVLCVLVINTRTWMPERYNKNHLGNGLAFLMLTKTRQEIIDADFSEVVYWVRERISQLKKEDFENDLHKYAHITKHGIDRIYAYHTRWVGDSTDYTYGRYIHDRDFMLSNVVKLPTLTADFGKGDPSVVRFDFAEEISHLTYFFKTDKEEKNFECYSAIPIDDLEFYQNNDIKNPNLDWQEMKRKYARETKHRFLAYPLRRPPLINFSALFDGRKDTQFLKW